MFPDRTTLAIIKLCACAALLIAGYLWARGNGVEAERKKSEAAIAVCQADRTILATALEGVNAKAEQAQRAASEQRLAANAAVIAAAQDRKAYEGRIVSIADELERAKRQPSCRAQLEQTLCVSLQ